MKKCKLSAHLCAMISYKDTILHKCSADRKLY